MSAAITWTWDPPRRRYVATIGARSAYVWRALDVAYPWRSRVEGMGTAKHVTDREAQHSAGVALASRGGK